ncbi:ATP-dependent DNA helicase RecQ [Halobacillus sp. GSS1]|uniref:protein DpdF n=1 Tax=Halobacillus sp. GSS1 TaxID=2815919 RepID=UPI001A8E15BE|nr:protein DpdF [Halobacillus sp. GSS1]MBN9653286.1 ATP-dependent DNA helicase RecQ [Halobacillus sp. GSS1]
MEQYIDIVELVVLKSIDTARAKQQIDRLVNDLTTAREQSKATCASRLVRSLHNIEMQNGNDTWFDFAVHLRQFILMHQYRLQLHADLAEQLRPIASEMLLSIDSLHEVNAVEQAPSWFTDAGQLRSVYQLEKRREQRPQIGDSVLYQATGYYEYSSPEQKALIRASFNMNEGETLLACLPTGGGKSLISQLPAHFNTGGGTTHGSIVGSGTTIVIVPTVALSIDQERASRRYFTNAISEEYMPQAYYGGISDDKRKIIKEGLLNGTLPLLYTSPEAVFNSSLYQIILDAGRHNRISRLVIDEAHIVVDWGGGFRTDFQLLTLFRRKLLAATNGKLRTLLFSATLTDYATRTLRKLFSEDEKITEIRSDSLRFEPIYLVDRPKNELEREERVLEALPLLPRPIILYVTSRKSASEWERLIKQNGYRSVKTFTGETGSSERESILRQWNDNELDIIVATSAFGMGVDKPDVRSIVHCCIPESINRYFQEVGRGGRDGYASISLISYIEDDKQEAASLTKSSVLKTEKLAKRWKALRSTSYDQVAGDKLWLNMSARPNYLVDQETGNQNVNWNETVILFLYRWGLIDILDVRKDDQTNKRQLLIHLLDLEVLLDSEQLIAKIDPLRKKERMRLNYEFKQMIDMIDDATDQCFGETFQEVYPHTQESCGGCPACFAKGNAPFYRGTLTERINALNREDMPLITGKVGQFLGAYNELFVTNQANIVQENNLDTVTNYLNEMVASRITTIVIPDFFYEKRKEIIKNLLEEAPINYIVITLSELFQHEHLYDIAGVVAILYPVDEVQVTEIYKWTQAYVNKTEHNKIIHIAPKDTFIFGERKKLGELVDGNEFNGELLIQAELGEEEFI